MADRLYLKKLTVDGQERYFKDEEARTEIAGIKQDISGGMHWRGVTTTELTDGATTNPVTIDGQPYTAKQGDEVTYNEMEFVWNGQKWQEYGRGSRLKALAFKDSASATYTPSGQNAQSAVTLQGGETKKLVKDQVGSASGWNAGTMFTATVDDASETLVLTPGTAPQLTVTQKDVATGETAASGTGATVATALHTGGTAAAQTFTGSEATITVS